MLVNGQVVVDPAGLVTLDVTEVVEESRDLAHRLATRANLLPR